MIQASGDVQELLSYGMDIFEERVLLPVLNIADPVERTPVILWYHDRGGTSVKTQNVALSLPPDLVREAEHVVTEPGMSLSTLVGSCLEKVVKPRPSSYEQARDRAITRMRQGLPMGVGERPGWTRDELHKR